MAEKITYLLVPVAHGYTHDQQTLSRCEALWKWCTEHKVRSEQCVIVLTARDLTNEVKKCLVDYFPDAQIIVSLHAWNTQVAIRNASKSIENYVTLKSFKWSAVKVVTSSNPLHLHGRVRIWWWRYKLKNGLRVIRAPGKREFTTAEGLGEMVKFVRDFLRIMFGR